MALTSFPDPCIFLVNDSGGAKHSPDFRGQQLPEWRAEVKLYMIERYWALKNSTMGGQAYPTEGLGLP